jgi:hypothetical protein
MTAKRLPSEEQPRVGGRFAAVYSESQKREALATYVEHGLSVAHAETAVPKCTLLKWARSAGIDHNVVSAEHAERVRNGTQARVARCEALRVEIREQLLQTAQTMLDRCEQPFTDYRGQKADEVEFEVPPPSECRQLVTAAAILIDKYRLEMGESTGRVETVAVEQQLEVMEAMRDDLAAKRAAKAS